MPTFTYISRLRQLATAPLLRAGAAVARQVHGSACCVLLNGKVQLSEVEKSVLVSARTRHVTEGGGRDGDSGCCNRGGTFTQNTSKG